MSKPNISLAGPRGLRVEDNVLRYEYEFYSSSPSNAYQRLSFMLPMAFDRHWAFEQYWYGMFRIDKHPKSLSGEFKSTLFRLFWLAEQGELEFEEDAIYTKNVSRKELHNHALGSAYRRHAILKAFRDDHVHSLQQCLPITLQMSIIILRSSNLWISEKFILLFRLLGMFAIKVLPCELRATRL